MTPELEKNIKEVMDMAYAQAVDHCSKVVEVFLIDVPGLAKPLIAKLQELKEPKT